MTAGVHLLWGEDAFLLHEAARELLGDLQAREVDAAQWQGTELQDLATPSMFGEPRTLLITDVKSLSKEAIAEIASYLEAPDPDSMLILSCRTADRGKPPVALVRLVEALGVVRQLQVPRKDLEPWLVKRGRAAGSELTPAAARALVESQGQVPGVLAAALEQLSDAFPGQRITPDLVHQQFRGLGDQKTWDLCDRAFAKDLPGAIRSMRAIEAGGDDPLMVLGGISSRLRDLIRVRELPDRLAPAQVAKAAGLKFDWQARRYQQQAKNFSLAELVRLHGRVTEADRAMKSGATGSVIMPALVTAIASR